ncbi:hypothetical protein CLOBY_08320 [Clostridium saccharobutylicum]|uniref:hypothetical protein n=1 Tax=Clostridium saccharobutylicum TaxID=169679 RepID=UPI000983D207|nr:hypothetical protein [Clostridium saccharobutylicum]AQS08722.1 hypothetical protein CLOBY_08320 [Clostridium saccharobutylicum]MBC2438869.1 hypothetical protein [Clostridium saccharobutylicum]NSB91145.1 hypothetical protein [Clostridium saccharobutylicum]NYC28933.1 hypothetical protein [Clostridium saccharobutylicum]OOM12853.1 hypothetical protein CLSAB_36610 [Clostridium saccharobutylicum]
MIIILKKLDIIIGAILIVILFFGVYSFNNKRIRIFENLDVAKIEEISISYVGGTFITTDKSQIAEIIDYLKPLKFSKRSDNSVPNDTPDAGIALIDKNEHAISGMAIYGDVARVYPKEKDSYTIPYGFKKDIEDLCGKYEENNKK